MAVPKVGNSNSRSEVQIILAVFIPQNRAHAPNDFKGRWGIVSNNKLFDVWKGPYQLRMYNLGTNSLISKNFQQNTVGHPSINEVHPIYASL